MTTTAQLGPTADDLRTEGEYVATVQADDGSADVFRLKGRLWTIPHRTWMPRKATKSEAQRARNE